MSDEQIVEYLRSRSQTTSPSDLVESVMEAVAGAPQRRHAWFAPLLPGVAAIAAAAVVLLATLVVARDPVGGPDLGPTPYQTATPSPSRSVPISPAPSPGVGGEPLDLLDEDAVVTFDAVDAAGKWGTITLTRWADSGDVLRVFVEYRADRMPEPAVFGAEDWSLIRVADESPVGSRLDTPLATEPVPEALRTYPGAVDIFTTPTEGMLYWLLPNEATHEELALLYQPDGFEASAVTIRVRAWSSAPSQSATAAPTPVPTGYVEREGLPFAVLASEEADRLFETPDSCTNPRHGYTVTFPDDWYTNTEIGEVPACSWFTPDFFEVDDPDRVPEEIWVSINVVSGVVGYTSITPVYFGGPVDLDGRPGHRNEFNPDANTEPDQRIYHYVADLGSQDRGPSFVASVSTTTADDYVLGKAVLDRIIATLEWTTDP